MMTREREAEIRELHRQLTDGRRHRRIAGVLGEVLDELDQARGETDELRREAGEWEERYWDVAPDPRPA